MDTLSLYETMSGLSASMVEAARGNDWDRLSELERQVAGLRDTLKRSDPPAAQASIAPEERARKRALIQQMLADDREIRAHTEPWMASVRELLSGQVRGRVVRAAYGAFSD